MSSSSHRSALGVSLLATPYTRLKEKLTNIYGKSKYQLCDELFDMPPPQHREAQHLDVQDVGPCAGGRHSWYVVLALFLRRLPEWMRRQLKAGGWVHYA